MKSAQQAAANYQGSAGRAQTEWTQGVQNYNGDWAGATTSQQAAMLSGVQEAVTSGRWARGVQNVGTSGWKQATQDKAANYGVGINAGVGKFTTAIGKIIQAEANIVGSLPPRGDVNQNIQRSVAFQQQMHALKGTLGA